jgi:tRNA dimethylallyltransferase
MNTSDPSAQAALPPLVIIAGPTASGKSGLALAVAEETGGTVINADSAQVYRDLRIVSARPSAADEARAPHRLYGTRDGADPCSAAAWAADARAEIDRAHAAERLPILVGGTGLYLRTLLQGIAPIPEIDDDIRAAVRAASVADNYRALLVEDPAAAAALRPGDSQRVARALEVLRSTGRTLNEWQAWRHGGIEDRVRIAARVLTPPREWLHTRCDARFAEILDGGLPEVEALLARRLDPDLPVMRAIGVRELAAFAHGELSRDEALARGQAATRAYAKRQYTWFRNQPSPDWVRCEAPLEVGETARLAELLAAAATSRHQAAGGDL